GVVLAAWMFSRSWVAGWSGYHYAISGVLLAMSSLTPLTGILTPEQFFGVGLPLIFGLVVIVNGTADHLLLRRFLSPIPKEEPNAVR
ncbi:MAG: hypothetical protein WA982_15520, partial [Rubrobacteraceae bacterium]